MNKTQLCVDVKVVRETPGTLVIETGDAPVYYVNHKSIKRNGKKEVTGEPRPVQIKVSKSKLLEGTELETNSSGQKTGGTIILDEWYATQLGIWDR